MEVVLLERVPNLGQMGAVVSVKPGYARNFLLPLKKALRATKENIAYFDTQRAQLEATNLKKKSEAEDLSRRLEGTTLFIIRQAGESGHLYGSVTPRDVAVGLADQKITISRTQVHLTHPIKEVGVHTCQLVLHPEVSMPVTLVVAQSTEEAQAKLQAVSGKAKTPVSE